MAQASETFRTGVDTAQLFGTLDAGADRYGFAMVPSDAPGVRVHDDWDAIGMRASGSHSVTFEAVELPPSALRGGFPVGADDELTDLFAEAQAAKAFVNEAATRVVDRSLALSGGAGYRSRARTATSVPGR